MLQEQIIDIPIVGGVDEGADPKLSTRPLAMRNCVQDKTGAISCRLGTEAYASANTYPGGTPTGSAPLTIAGVNGSVLSASRRGIQRILNTPTFNADRVEAGARPCLSVIRDTVATGPGSIVSCDIAVNGDYALVVYILQSIAVPGGPRAFEYTAHAKAIQLSTLTTIEETRLQFSALQLLHGLRVVSAGSSLHAIWQEATGIYAKTFSTANASFSVAFNVVPLASVSALLAGANFDVHSAVDTLGVAVTRVYIAYKDAATGQPFVGSWTSALVPIMAPVSVSANAVSVSIAVEASEWSIPGVVDIYVAWDHVSGTPSTQVRLAQVLEATMVATWETVAYDPAVISDYRALGIGVGDAASAYRTAVAFNEGTSARVLVVDHGGAVTLETAGLSCLCEAIGRPFWVYERIHLPVVPISSQGSSGLIVSYDWALGRVALSADVARIECVFAVRQMGRRISAFRSSARPRFNIDDDSFVFATSVAGALPDQCFGAILRGRFGVPAVISVAREVLFSGGAPSTYDGSTLSELGFANEPWYSIAQSSVASSSPGTGFLTPLAVYRYLLVYEWYSADGRIMRSPPSDQSRPITVTMGAADDTVTMQFPCLTLTNKRPSAASAQEPVHLVLYRTLPGQGTYYRATSIEVPVEHQNRPAQTSFLVTDILSDAELAVRPLLYTTGDLPPDEIPPSASHVAQFAGRVWLSGTDDDTIWFSDRLLVGESPKFSGLRTIAPFEGGRVVAMATLGETKHLILKRNAVYWIHGEGPNTAVTAGDFSAPEELRRGIGCIDVRSVVETPLGVYFLSKQGIVRVGKDGSITMVGRAVEDTTDIASDDGAVISSAVYLAEDSRIRFTVGAVGNPTGTVVEFDEELSSWSVHEYRAGVGDGSASAISCACEVDGRWHYGTVLNQNGRVYRDTPGVFVDRLNTVSEPIPQVFRTRPISLTGVQGYQRIWDIGFSGTLVSRHGLEVRIFADTDDAEDDVQVETMSAAEVAAMGKWQPIVHVVKQETQSLSAQITVNPDVAEGNGGVILRSIQLSCAVEQGFRPRPGRNMV